MKYFKALAACLLAAMVSACGTTYQMPGIDEALNGQASKMFAEAQNAPDRRVSSVGTGVARFKRVARRVEPVAKQFCEQELASQPNFDCAVLLEIDREMKERNAYFTYQGPGNQNPVIRFTVPMLQDAKNDDELAFILGHEYGHLIGQHVQKQQQQAVAGALILGVMAAAVTGSAGSYDSTLIDTSVDLGAAVGGQAFSQTYELESDMLGTRIAAAAGYDPIEGAKYFARGEEPKSENGQLSFWGTHPPDAERVAVVLATVQQIETEQGLERK